MYFKNIYHMTSSYSQIRINLRSKTRKKKFPPCIIKQCNAIFLNEDYVNQWLQSSLLSDITNSSLLNTKFPSNISQISNNYFFGTIVAMNDAFGLNVTDTVRRSFGLSFDQFFVSCMFSFYDCSPSDWRQYYDAKYGLI
jgi:hypothetical protein